MTKSDINRLIKIENRIRQIFEEYLGLTCIPIEFDIVPPQKMLEIMAYNIPTNISNWKKGRDYERQRTIYEYIGAGLPYEVVINADPARAYLMNNNKFSVQCLVIAHVYGHACFFTHNKFFQKSRQDIMVLMKAASERFNNYEKRFGIDEVEKTVDAGHALQHHSSPFTFNETEKEKRKRIFEQEKKKAHAHGGVYGDMTGISHQEINEDIELFNQKLWRKLRLKTPVEPTDDLLRYIIDNSTILEDWQVDILEVLRTEGQYYWPIMKTKFMNEGLAVVIHEKIMTKLFEEGLLTSEEHADFNYSNSLVKAENPFGLNPYLIGSMMWRNIEERWDKGQYGSEWEDCTSVKTKEEWDTGDMKGWDKCKEVMKVYSDWFFMQEFLTPELIRDMRVYLFNAKDAGATIDYVITKDTAEEIRLKLLNAFAQNILPSINIVNGNYEEKGLLLLEHNWNGVNLDESYAKETMRHISYLWGRDVVLNTNEDKEDKKISWKVSYSNEEVSE
jgi:stage V sporulation protein R